MDSVKRCVLICAFGAAMLLGTTASAQMIHPSLLGPSERAELESVMAEDIELTLKGMKPVEGQLFPAGVSARFDAEGKTLLVEMGRRFVVKTDGTTVSDVEVQDQLHALTSVLSSTIPEVSYEGIEYLFEGKEIVDYYPELRKREKKSSGETSTYPSFPPYIPPPVNGDPSRMYIPPQPYPTQAYTPPSVAINPGHGLYKLYGAGTLNPNYRWTAQRDRSNGVLEDEITPEYAAELKHWFAGRSPAFDTFLTRSTSSQVHTQSTQESASTHLWSDMGVKYRVEQLYPERADLWDATSRTDEQRDRSKDINSRALFADEMGAQAMISLHTNAAPTPETALTARGTQVFYSVGEPEGQALASSIACYMGELIRAQSAYQNWVMRETRGERFAENSGSMPSALVEIAFHTHPDNARALLDPAFRTASMKGVEKGYRMWERGNPCQPLAITSVSDASGANGTKPPVEVQYSGHPAFPATMKIEIVRCPTGYICHSGTQVQETEIPSPLIWNFGCGASASTPTSTVRVRTTLIDSDGVRSNPVESHVTCTSATRAGATYEQDTMAPVAASIR